MENVQKTRRLFASAYGCKASRFFSYLGLVGRNVHKCYTDDG